MTSRTFMCIAAAVLVTAWGSCCLAAEVYTWTDKHGVTHISDTPPQQPVKLKSVDTFRRGGNVPGYDPGPGVKHRPNYRPRRASRDVERVIKEDAARSPRSVAPENPAEGKEDKNQRVREEIESLEAKSLRIQHYKTGRGSNESKQYWQEEQKQVEREIERKKKQLN